MPLLNGPLPARVTWALLPIAMGPALGTALNDHSRAVSLTGEVLAWGVWAVALVAVLIPRTVSLTVARIAAPLALVVASWAALGEDRNAVAIASVTWAALTVVMIYAPATGDSFANGSSYGDERRSPLRIPTSLLFGPVQLAWIAAVAAPVGVPLLVAARQWAAAALLGAVGLPLSWLAIRALHGLARRWVVFVPAGLVLHDLHALVDPVLFPRATIRNLGPAPADSAARDLTQRALGLALELELVSHAEIAPRHADGTVRVESVEQVLFTPTRPAVVLREAAARRIAVS